MITQYLDINPEVQEALEQNKAVVALESTIISHGMPYPQNVETALQCEKVVRKNGAIPATIAIIDGMLKVGLTTEEIDFLGKEGVRIQKTSRRDIAYNVAHHINGATTVSATMFIAAMAGIHVFATGGIGGVHRHAETTMDISADLEELATTNVTVVCAGAKSILDLGLTLEYLETKGVPVLGYQTSVLPAFFTRESDFNVNFRVDTPQEIADMMRVKKDLKLRGGMLVTNPIPSAYSMPKSVIDKAIDEALHDMDNSGISGKEATPFLLSKIVDITAGTSLASNIQLVYNNCKLASEISVALHNSKEMDL